jgi:hypothetical protein
MYDYFSAGSDDLAASAIEILGGPGGPVSLPMPVHEIVRLRGREGLRELLRPRLRQTEAGFRVVSTKGFDPVADLGAVEEILTRTDFAALLARSRHGHVLVQRDGGERCVVTISDELQTVLASTGIAGLSAAAGQWVRGNRGDSGDAALLAHLLSELSALARGASERNERLYCWICVLSPRSRLNPRSLRTGRLSEPGRDGGAGYWGCAMGH